MKTTILKQKLHNLLAAINKSTLYNEKKVCLVRVDNGNITLTF